MNTDIQIKLAVYNHFAKTGKRPAINEISGTLNLDQTIIRDAYQRLFAQRVLVLESDPSEIRMAPPFSGIPTQHRVFADGINYYANCGWDALGILAALKKPGTVFSECEQSKEPFQLEVDLDGPEESDWIFHSLVPASKWWDNIVFT